MLSAAKKEQDVTESLRVESSEGSTCQGAVQHCYQNGCHDDIHHLASLLPKKTEEERRKAEAEAKRKAEAEAKRLAAEAEVQRRAEAKVGRQAMGFLIRGVGQGDG